MKKILILIFVLSNLHAAQEVTRRVRFSEVDKCEFLTTVQDFRVQIADYVRGTKKSKRITKDEWKKILQCLHDTIDTYIIEWDRITVSLYKKLLEEQKRLVDLIAEVK